MNGQDIKITQSLKEEWIEKCHELQKDKGKA
jgi:hypothetical protein